MSNFLKANPSIRYVSERGKTELNTTGAYVETESGDPEFECCCDFELKKITVRKISGKCQTVVSKRFEKGAKAKCQSDWFIGALKVNCEVKARLGN